MLVERALAKCIFISPSMDNKVCNFFYIQMEQDKFYSRIKIHCKGISPSHLVMVPKIK